MTSLRVLIVEDSDDDALLLTDQLRHGGFAAQSRVVDDISEVESALTEEWDIIISDYVLPDFTAMEVLELARRRAPDIPFLVVSGKMGEDVAVETMRGGASDYLLKNDLSRLAPAIERELSEAQIRRDRRLARKALAESEERYRTLFERSNDGILVVQDGIIRLLNQRFCEISGYDIEDLLNTPFTDHLPPDEAARLYDNYRRRIAGENVPSTYEAVITRHGGIKLDIEISASIISYEGKPADMVICRDISERKLSQRELEKARDFAENAARLEADTRATLEALLSATPVGIITVDAATRKITYSNAAAAGILGGPVAGLGGLPEPDSYQLLRLDETPFPHDEMPLSKALVRGRLCRNEQMLVRRPDGSRVNMQVTCAPVLDTERRITGAVATLDDITELVELRKDIEEALDRERQFSLLLQRALLPGNAVIGEGYGIGVAYVPVFVNQEIGGDFYDTFNVADSRAGILIGDVSGKGLEAAAMAATTRSTVHAFFHETPSPGEALIRTDAVLGSSQIAPGSFVTVCLVALDVHSGDFSYSSAGHPPAMISRSTGVVDIMEFGDVPLGLAMDWQFEEHHGHLEEGDKLVLYTDGISEARRGSELLELGGVERILRENSQLPADQLAQALMNGATEWAGGNLSDDAAVVVLERQLEIA